MTKFDTSAALDAGFTLRLTGADGGIVYEASVPVGSQVALPGARYLYRNLDSIRTGGISYLRIVRIKGRPGFRATIRGYGDLSRASAHMTTHIILGLQEWAVVGTWTQARDRWRLPD